MEVDPNTDDLVLVTGVETDAALEELLPEAAPPADRYQLAFASPKQSRTVTAL
jgi:hypothetical protein